MNKLFCVLAAGLLASCSSDWSAGLADKRTSSAATGSPAISAEQAGGSAASAAAPGMRAARPFANAPDRGSLLQYPADPVVRRSGAYTWHAADLSEEHAFRAARPGAELRLPAPDGTLIRLAYERHVEHGDGNWSWVGRTANGQSTVLTFGETAAFGDIPQGTGQAPLRLTTANGRPWLVTADRRLLAGVRNEATDPSKPDYFIPPPSPVPSFDSATSGVQPAGATTAAADASGKTVIDLLVGYTEGFRLRAGEAAALTRIHQIVELTNQAYIDSRVDTTIRLVHAMPVAYPDATKNGTALAELTGYNSTTREWSTPHQAFSQLRQAREQYGADLVTLLRVFNTPENEGCGVAWLLGGNRTQIVQGHERYGYSVVSDGQDADVDGKNYYCRPTTLAHELGHNLGSQHDSANAEKDDGTVSYGAYTYSFGLKTAEGTGNFFTIMAYGDRYQNEYFLFSNPNVTSCNSSSCGVNDSADNARSLNQTSAIIAGFRATVVPIAIQRKVADDFNGDGISDILWRNFSTGDNAIWLGAASSTTQPMLGINNFAWTIVGTGDFNGDGASDVLWRNTSTGANAVWLSANKATQIPMTTIPNQSWTVVGVGDFDGDGLSDILWRNVASGANSIWRSGNYALTQAVTQVADLRWTVVGVGDFNGDGRSDILWRHASTGGNAVWYSADYATRTNLATISDLRWKVVGVGDFDGDGRSDILWRHDGTGSNAIWRSANKATALTLTRISNLDWTVVDVADYNGDGQSDVLWRNVSSGANSIWRSGNYGDPQAVTRVSNLAWRVVGD